MNTSSSSALFQKPQLIQRMSCVSRSCRERMGLRFDYDYMGSTEFEQGLMGKAIRLLHERCEVGEVLVDGVAVLAVWNPDNYNKAGVALVLNKLYNGEYYTKEYTNFNQDYRRKHFAPMAKKSPQERRKIAKVTDAWFDIQHGLFWTWDRCNIQDLRKNIAASVEWMNLSAIQGRSTVNCPFPFYD